MDDKIVTNCSACNGQFRIPAKYAGKTIKCPKCQQPLEIPNLAVQAPPPMAPPPMAPPPVAPPPAAMAIPNESVKISAWEKAKTAPKPADGMRKAPAPIKKAPGKKIDRRPSNPGSRPQSRAHSNHKSGVRGRASGVRDNGRRPAGRQGFRDDRYEPEKKNNMPLIIGISAIGLVLLIVVFAVMFGGGDGTKAEETGEGTKVASGKDGTKDPDGNTPDKTTPPEKTDAEKRKETVDNAISELKTEWDKGIKDNNLSRVFSRLQGWRKTIISYPELKDTFNEFKDKYFQERTKEIESLDEGDERALEILDLVKNYKELDDDSYDKVQELCDEAIAMADDYKVKDQIHAERGDQKYIIPTGEQWDFILRYRVSDSNLSILQNSDQRWVTQSELSALKQTENEILNAYNVIQEEINKDEFYLEILKERQRLRLNEYFRDFDFDVVNAKPFAVLLESEDDEAYKQSILDRKATLQTFWELLRKNWLDRLNLKSSIKDDTPENPKPFSFVSFKNKENYDLYLKKVDKVMPDFARAFFNPSTKCVMFYKDTRPNKSTHFEFAVVAHEATHQVHDRYSPTPEGLKSIHSYWITEGFAELMAGHSTDKDGTMHFQNIHYPDRMKTFGIYRDERLFGDKKSYVYDNLKNENVPFMPPREDANLVPIEALVVASIRGTVYWYGTSLANLYEAGYRKAYQNSNPRDPVLYNRATLLKRFNGGPAQVVHGQFYSTAWAFTQFMTQRYPDEYDQVFLAASAGKSAAQAFNKAFKLGLDLPEIFQYVVSNDRLKENQTELIKGMITQLKMIQSHERVIKLQDEFDTWLREAYKKVIGKPISAADNDMTDDDDDDDEEESDDDTSDDDDDDDDWIHFSEWNK